MAPLRRRVGVGLLVAFAAALALAAPTQASHNNLRIGVSSAAYVDGVELARMGAGGVAVMRIDFLWREVEPIDGNPYIWTKYDALVSEGGAAGVELLPVIIGSPRDVAPTRHPPTTEVDRDRYRRFLKALVERYGRDGDFWCQSPDAIAECSPNYEPITAYQIWNEVSLDTYWTNGDPNAKQYADFLRLSRKAIESRDEKARIVLAGLPYATNAGMDMKPYLKDLYDVDGVKKDFDALAAHTFGRNEDDVKFILREARDLMDNRGDENTPIWVTEVGWGTNGTKQDRNNGFVKSPAGQADVLGDTFSMIQSKRDPYNIGTVAWFSWRDYPPDGNADWYEYAGLFEYGSGLPKPAWEAYTDFTGGNPGVGPLPPPAGGAAAASSDGFVGPTRGEGLRAP